LCPVSLCIPSSSRSPDHDPHRTIYYLRYPLGRFAGLKHRQLACQVGVIITTGRIRRTLINKINLLVDSPRSIEARHQLLRLRRASRCLGTLRDSSRGSSLTTSPRQARRRLLHIRRASRCFGTWCGLSCDSSSTTSPRAGSSSTTSPPSCVRVPRHVARLVTRLVVDYFSSRRLTSTTSPTPRVWLLRHVVRLVAPLVVDYFASRRLVVDYFSYAARPVASARRAACRMTHRRLLRLAQARRRLLHLCCASGCFGTSRDLSRDSSSTTSPRAGSSSNTLTPPRV
jgi:hypothetical protein